MQSWQAVAESLPLSTMVRAESESSEAVSFRAAAGPDLFEQARPEPQTELTLPSVETPPVPRRPGYRPLLESTGLEFVHQAVFLAMETAGDVEPPVEFFTQDTLRAA